MRPPSFPRNPFFGTPPSCGETTFAFTMPPSPDLLHSSWCWVGCVCHTHGPVAVSYYPLLELCFSLVFVQAVKRGVGLDARVAEQQHNQPPWIGPRQRRQQRRTPISSAAPAAVSPSRRGASMSRQRPMEGPSTARGAPSSSDAALHTTQLVEQLARSLMSERSGRHGPDAVPSEVQIHGAVRLCIRILTSHIGEPLMVEDEAAVTQAIRTRLVKVTETERDMRMMPLLRASDLNFDLKSLLSALECICLWRARCA